MENIARFRVAREPDLALANRGTNSGWALLRSDADAQHITSSPAALLLNPTQASAIEPLTNWIGGSTRISGHYDSLHTKLHDAFLSGDWSTLTGAAQSFVDDNPPLALYRQPSIVQAVHRFFIFRGIQSNAAERRSFYESIPSKEREKWFQEAPNRIDLEKARALAFAAAGKPPPKNMHILGGLQADLAFCVLAACLQERERSGQHDRFANKHVDRIVNLAANFPHFIFEIDPCSESSGRKSPSVLHLPQARRFKDIKDNLKADGDDDLQPDEPDPCDCSCEEKDLECLPVDPCCVELMWYETELLTLHVENHCYKPSDIAYIENIAPFETRIRKHGHTRSQTQFSEEETNVSKTEEYDHQRTDKFSLQREIDNQRNLSLDVDAKLSGKVYGQDYEIKTSASLSKESAYREAREQVRETVERAAVKLQTDRRRLSSRTVTDETTESNKHKFCNPTATPAVAKYFYVTQEKRAQVFSHGPALTIDMLIPSPAMLFRRLEEIRRKIGFTRKLPDDPIEPKIGTKALTPGLIAVDNYEVLVANYGVTEYDEPPEQGGDHWVTFQISKEQGSHAVTIPAGHTATKLEMTGKDLNKNVGGVFARIRLTFGGGSVEYSRNWKGEGSSTKSVVINTKTSGTATIDTENAKKKSYIAAKVLMTPDLVDLGPWQKSIFALVMTKYQEQLEAFKAEMSEYDEALRAYNEEYDERRKTRHPFTSEEHIRTQVKQAAIFKMCGEMDWPDVWNLKSMPCGLPVPNRKKASEATNVWYWYDRAFNWSHATFTFYDHFRNPMCKWAETYDIDEPNFLFKAFLRAGYVRLQLPVSPGMEEDVRNFVQTGGLWGETGTRPSDPDDPRWVSVIEEIKHARDCDQQDREGHAEAYRDPSTGSFDSRIRVYTDRYWNVDDNVVDYGAIGLDIDHEIFIDGSAYRIVGIEPDPASSAYDPAAETMMWWIVGLERKFGSKRYIDPDAASPLLKPYNYAVGAKYIGAPFHFDLPTDLIWIGDHDNLCLPCYPMECGPLEKEGPGDDREVPPRLGHGDGNGDAPRPDDADGDGGDDDGAVAAMPR